MGVKIVQVSSNKSIRDFIRFPYSLYRDDPNWITPLFRDEVKSLTPGYNPAFRFCDAAFWLAFRDGICLGRIGAIINHHYNRKTCGQMGRISRAEFIDDAEVVNALFDTAEQWIRDRGMNGVHGPLGFTNFDNQGLLIEGFDYLPSIASVHNKAYYRDYWEKRGYMQENDWIEFRLKVGEIPEKVVKLNELIRERMGLKVISFRTNTELMRYGPKIFGLLNQAFAELPYVSAFDDDLASFYTNKYFKLINPKLVKVVESSDGFILGFVVGISSLSRAMQKAGGSLLPFGFFHLRKALRKPTVVDLLLTGVDPRYQGKGIPALLITEIQQEVLNFGVTEVETTGIFETNQKAIQHWKNYDHIQHKRRRCYRKMF